MKKLGAHRGKIDLLKKVGNRTREKTRRNQAEAEEGTQKGTAGRNERKQGIMTMWDQTGPCSVTPCFVKQQFFSASCSKRLHLKMEDDSTPGWTQE